MLKAMYNETIKSDIASDNKMIKGNKMSKIFNEISKQRRDSHPNSRSDCTVISATILTGKPYKECFDAFKQSGRKDEGGANVPVIKAAFKLLGYRLVPENTKHFTDKIKGVYNYNTKSLTTKHPDKFPKVFDDARDMLWLTTSHSLAFHKRNAEDWSNTRSLRVTNAYYVEKLPDYLL